MPTPPYSPSRVEISIPKPSADGLYWGRYPNGDKPVGMVGAARIGSSAAAVLTSHTKLAASAAVNSAAAAVLSGGSSPKSTPLLFDDMQTVPFSIQPQGSNVGNVTWARADDYNYNVDPGPANSSNHARVGTRSTRFQLTFTQNLVGGVYNQWVSNNGSTTESAHRNEANITGLLPFPPTGWNRVMHRAIEYWMSWSIFIPKVGDPFGEDFPVTPWPGYLILFQLHDSGTAGNNPVFEISLEANPNGSGGNRTNWCIRSASSDSPTRNPNVPHTNRAYLLHPWAGDAGHWVDFVLRYKPDYVQYTGTPPPTASVGILQLWMSCQTLGEDALVVNQINFPNSGINSATDPDSSPYAVPAAFYCQPAALIANGGKPNLTSPSQGTPAYDAPPPTNYPHRFVNYWGWWDMLSTAVNPQAAVTSSNFAYAAVKPPGNRAAAP